MVVNLENLLNCVVKSNSHIEKTITSKNYHYNLSYSVILMSIFVLMIAFFVVFIFAFELL